MAPQDSFIDEDDDCCPLCVEDFDLSDRNFRPCPCGYQICQFCFNNIKNNMNNLCPACRRPYDEKTIEWKSVTQEELQQHKANIQKNAKKKADQRQREAQKKEVENMNRKHLQGLRVVQKNLVYVTGLASGIREDEILATLRGPQYFGQYGQILKIVVGRPKPGEGRSNEGVYVTYASHEDARKCINAVNGSQNGDRVLKAQLGTTKYCSSFLRNEVCTNKHCMFLHESSDSDDSYSRQDMSSINSVVTQVPLAGSSSQATRQAARSQAPLQHVQPVAAAAPMARDPSQDASESGDGSALPSSASWAKQRSRRGSIATSGAASSPAISQSMPVTDEVLEEPTESAKETNQHQEDRPESATDTIASNDESFLEAPKPKRDPILLSLLKTINSDGARLVLSSPISAADATSFPPLFDEYGGEKRRIMRELQQQEDDKLQKLEQERGSQIDQSSVAEPVEEDEPESGSLQLGGEPEDRDASRETSRHQFQRRPSGQLPIQRTSTGGAFGPALAQGFPQINGHTLTPLQQQQLRLMKSSQQPNFMDHFPPGMGNSIGQSSSGFQPQGHTRQPSRYASVMENSANSVKGATNPKFLAQQSLMMPQQGNQYYSSAMQGPPGLKSSGTPVFGQGHGFGGSLFTKENANDSVRDMSRGRGVAGANHLHDAGKREYNFPSFLQQYPSASTPAPASGLMASLYSQTGAFHDYGQKQKKKGKKHRHANTSSSGGSGLVNDLVDPGILQARLQQYQQQSNAGVGQGLFGGQAQGGYNQNMMHGGGFTRW
ncbi:hypothetical protein BJ878DRAFT_415920 [Calycina marina]|uniref:CCR4-NOT transcription complex subunit 4 n=1 Tax=Calycina marina TaxID=1763456 RepID=A0A9P7Z8K9_9HELO|nr:hypothetical protein BJ878DRAFT_415920 [Calycina marina]